MSAVDLINTLGRTLGFSVASGINLHATVAPLGLASHYRWVDLPTQYLVFNNNWIIGTAMVLYVVEFIADRIPWLDSVWDAVHTVVRQAGGALIAVPSIGHAQPAIQAAAPIVGAALATSTHLAKAARAL